MGWGGVVASRHVAILKANLGRNKKGLGKAWHGNTMQAKAGQGKTGHGIVTCGMASQVKARQGRSIYLLPFFHEGVELTYAS